MQSDSRDPLDLFPLWLAQLGSDTRLVADALTMPEVSAEQRVWLASGLNYLLKSVDLIPDGVQDLGYLDDAFVLRAAVREAHQLAAFEGEGVASLARLATEAGWVSEFLDSDAEKLDDYVSGLRISKVRGRSPSDIGEDDVLAAQVVDEVKSWVESYIPPTFARDEKTLVKLKAFLSTKLA